MTMRETRTFSRLSLDEDPVNRGQLLWTWDGRMVSALGRMPMRMCVAGYDLLGVNVGLVVISPIEPTEKVTEWLKQQGQVCFIVAPNTQHHWWAEAMKAAFPAALLIAPSALKEKKPQLPIDIEIGTTSCTNEDLPDSWPVKDIDMTPMKGAEMFQELAFFHKPSATLILADLAFNFDDKLREAEHLGMLLQLYLSLAGGNRRCCVTKPFKFLIKDPVALKASFDHILSSWEFDQVCMCHGTFIDQGGKQALQEGSYAFVKEMVEKKQQGGTGRGGILPVALTAGAVLCALVGLKVAGVMQARSN